MAYAASGLVLWSHGNDKKFFRYDSSVDTLATIAAAGYFANTANASRLAVGDIVYAVGSDNAAFLKVTAVAATTGSVTTTGASKTDAVLTASTGSTLPGYGEILISSTAAQAYALPAPVIGAELTILKTSSSTAVQTVSSTLGGTAATIGLTGVTLTFSAADQSVILRGVSSTKWQIASNVGSVAVS
jgi:hypothetical protein